jgi:hypothetical protein
MVGRRNGVRTTSGPSMTITIHRARLDWRVTAVFAAALIASLGILLGTAGPAVACSCAMNSAMKEYATAEHAVFAGTAGDRQDRGVPVDVTQWLWGQGAADVVWLTASSFGDSAGCGTNPPPPGTSWIWVAWLPGNNGDFGTGLCSPAAQLDTPEGQAMLADALTVFNAAAPPGATPEPTHAPESPSSPEPEDGGRDPGMLWIGGLVILASLGMFGAVALIARRQNRAGSGQP